MAGEQFKLGAVLEFANKAGKGIQSAQKDLGGLSTAAKAVGGAIVAAGVVEAGKAAYELGVLGAQSLRTKHAFEMISGSAYEATDNLDAMKRATRGAMSEQEMMATANQLLQMGLAGNASELESVTEMAVRLGGAMGKEAGPAVAEFSLMLANQSIPRLDTFGISAGKVRERIQELQKATPGLSREIAFMTAVNEEGAIALERLGDAAEDELLANERLEASMADLKVMAGEMLAPAMAEVAEVLADTTRHIITQADELEAFTTAYGDAAVGAFVLEHGLYGTAEAADAFNQMLEDAAMKAEGVALAVEGGRTRIDGWSTAIIGSAAAATETATAMDGLATSAKTVAGSFGEMEFDDEQLWKMAAASGASLPELEELAAILGIASSAEIEATKTAYELIEGFGEGTTSAKDLAAGFSELETETIAAEGGFEGLDNASVLAEKGILDLSTAEETATATTRDLDEGLGNANLTAAEFRDNIDIVAYTLEQMAGEYFVKVHYETAGSPPNLQGPPPGMQSGTSFHRGGLALIGERGPELVALPRGSRVWPTSSPQSQAAVNNRYHYGGDTVIINDRLAANLYMERRRRERIQRVERM